MVQRLWTGSDSLNNGNSDWSSAGNWDSVPAGAGDIAVFGPAYVSGLPVATVTGTGTADQLQILAPVQLLGQVVTTGAGIGAFVASGANLDLQGTLLTTQLQYLTGSSGNISGYVSATEPTGGIQMYQSSTLSVTGTLAITDLIAGNQVGLTVNGGTIIASGGQNGISGNGNVGLDLAGTVVFDGAQINAAGYISVGNSINGLNGGSGTLTVQNGTTVQALYASTGGSQFVSNTSGDQGSILITGPNTTWTNSGAGWGYLADGMSGSGTITVSNGARLEEVTSGQVSASIGISYPTSQGTLTVTGAGSQWINNKEIVVGQAGSGVVRIDQGGSATAQIVLLGFETTGSGTITVDGAGSSLINDGFLDDGYRGKGVVTVQNGATMTAAAITLGDVSGDGTLTVTGTGSLVDDSNLYMVDGFSSTGTVSVTNHATLLTADAYLGWNAGANGTTTVDNAMWHATLLTVGLSGNGSLAIRNGGTVQATLGMVGGSQDGGVTTGQGTVTVDGASSQWAMLGDLTVGQYGYGEATISGGAKASSYDGIIGGDLNATGVVTVTGAKSSWTNVAALTVGVSGTATLNIAAAGAVTAQTLSVGQNGPSAGGRGGVIAIDGGSSTLGISGDANVGDGGYGEVDITNGGTFAVTGGALVIGAQATGFGVLDLDGAASRLNHTGNLTAGENGTGLFEMVNGATFTVTGDLIVGSQATATGYVDLSGTGTSLTVNGKATIGESGQGNLTLANGSTMEVDGDLEESAQAGSGGQDIVRGTGTALTIGGDWKLGVAGDHTSFVELGALASVGGGLTVAENTGVTAGLHVSGGASVMVTGKDATVGGSGTGSADITSGGQLTILGHDLTLGEQLGGVGNMTVLGVGSAVHASALTVGGGGTGGLIISSGGAVTAAKDVTLGEKAGSTGGVSLLAGGSPTSLTAASITIGGSGGGSFDVNGAGATVSTADITVGESAGASGVLTIEGGFVNGTGDLKVGATGSGGATITAGGTVTSKGLTVGEQAGGTGTLALDGAGSLLIAAGDIVVGSAGHGALVVAGAASLQGLAGMTLGDQANGIAQTATVGTGAKISVAKDMAIGGSGQGIMTVGGGAYVNADGNGIIGDKAGSSGTLIVSGTSTVAIFGLSLAVGNAGSGTLLVNGGTVAANPLGPSDLTIGAVVGSTGTAEVDPGGTLVGYTLNIGGDVGIAGGNASLYLAGGEADSGLVEVFGHGTVTLNAGVLNTSSGVTIDAGGSVIGAGTIIGTLANSGTVDAIVSTLTTGGSTVTRNALEITGSVTGAGTLMIGGHATLALDGALATAPIIQFGTVGELILSTPGTTLANAVSGLGTGQRFEFGNGMTITGASLVNANTISVAFHGSQGFPGTYNITNASFGPGVNPNFAFGTDAGTGLTYLDVNCFLAGTRIAAEAGEVPIESLRVGDRLWSVLHESWETVVWIGERAIDCRRHPRPGAVCPIRITADAFGQGVPARDLYLSPDHAVAIDGVLMPVKLLVNGASIRRETDWGVARYFHVELARHDLLLAEGLAAETYLDAGNRGVFAKAGAPVALHPVLWDPAKQQQREANSCLPIHTDPAAVRPAWERLAARSDALGHAVPRVATCADPALCLVADGRTILPASQDGARVTFVVPALPGGARLRSRHCVPAASRPWVSDPRRLGVAISALTVRDAATDGAVALDDPRLGDGWWEPEYSDGRMWRWTDGNAALPPLCGPTVIEVTLAATQDYPLPAEHAAGRQAA